MPLRVGELPRDDQRAIEAQLASGRTRALIVDYFNGRQEKVNARRSDAYRRFGRGECNAPKISILRAGRARTLFGAAIAYTRPRAQKGYFEEGKIMAKKSGKKLTKSKRIEKKQTLTVQKKTW